MEEQLISFETAKLAKEKGFNQWNDAFYDISKFEKLRKADVSYFDYQYDGWSPNEEFDNEDAIYAYTQSLLQKWLRDEHEIHIEILLEDNPPYTKFYYRIMKLGHYFTLSHDGIYSNSYEEILEIALQKALKLI